MANRIIIAINLDEGLYNFRSELVEALINKGYEVHLAMPRGEYAPFFEKMGAIVHDTPLDRRGTNPIKELSLIKRYGEILAKVSPGAVITYTIKPNIYMGWQCSLRGIPYITTITGLGSAVSGDGILSHITRIMYKCALSRVRTVFFQNEENKAVFEKSGIARGKYRMLPGSGVNLERFSYMEFPAGGPVEFLFISRIMKEKGIGEYIETAGAIKRSFPDIVFRVLGFMEDDYGEREAFDAAVKEGIIVYEGSVSDVRPYIQKAQCIIHPSYYPEGMSNVCLEAAASGRAVITTDRPGCRDTVIDGESGYIIKERDTLDLIEKTERFLALTTEYRCEMGRAGRRYMEMRFDRHIVTNELLKAVEDI